MADSELGEVSFHLNTFHSQFPIPPLILQYCQDVVENCSFPVQISDGFILGGTPNLGAAALSVSVQALDLAMILLVQESKYKQLEGKMLSSLLHI